MSALRPQIEVEYWGHPGPGGTRMLHEVAQMSMVPTSAALPSLPRLLLWPQGVFLMISGREDLGLLCRCSTYGTFAGTTRKWTGAALQPLPGTSLKDNGEGKSSREAGLQAMHPVVLPAWTEEWPDVLLCPGS